MPTTQKVAETLAAMRLRRHGDDRGHEVGFARSSTWFGHSASTFNSRGLLEDSLPLSIRLTCRGHVIIVRYKLV